MSRCCDELAEEKMLTKNSIANARRERVMLGEAREEDKE
jgi:chorismate mutase